MEYGKLIAVTGMPGLFELVSSKSDGAIVRSLDDNSTKFASTRQHQFSHLESIEVYTVRDNVNLTDIFKAMESAGGKLPDEKDAKAIKAYFEKVYPDLDFERVYTSDMKKMVKWYGIISAKGIEIKLTEVAEEEAPVEEAVVEDEAKPAKKAAKKKAEPKAEEVATEEAPKKKAAAKKKKED
ncbi:DUF5606 domain-containing protein [Lacibacter sp.]|jgi:hypothetical protein|uniref:DUF5606 family protein n=1 Tax=Lacibacter sp. TaxID=1915409 RepID=UPI002B4B8D7B|nr:DUF5606 domain-containing protein [Lacibacter sp.]HLP38418.1 DUF5606 domain-containing protein [Lacibacter sp.]